MKLTNVTAKYERESHWQLKFDLNEVHAWHIENDCLYVKHTSTDEEYETYEPHQSFKDDLEDGYNIPNNTNINVYEASESYKKMIVENWFRN